MIGQRIADGSMPSFRWPAGAYGRVKIDGEWDWHAVTPNGMHGNLSNHEVVEHDDGTITVSPSILVTKPPTDEAYHGYLERGVWREC